MSLIIYLNCKCTLLPENTEINYFNLKETRYAIYRCRYNKADGNSFSSEPKWVTVSKTLVTFRTPLFLPSLAIQWFFQHRFAHREFEQAWDFAKNAQISFFLGHKGPGSTEDAAQHSSHHCSESLHGQWRRKWCPQHIAGLRKRILECQDNIVRVITQ